MLSESRVAFPIAPADVQRILREQYGIDGEARSLPGEYDQNVHIRAVDGREFVLKVMHPAREASFVEMQCKALAHLANCRVEVATAQGDR